MELWYSQEEHVNASQMLTTLNRLDLNVTDEFKTALLFAQSQPHLQSLVDMIEQLSSQLEFTQQYKETSDINEVSYYQEVQEEEVYVDEEECDFDLYDNEEEFHLQQEVYQKPTVKFLVQEEEELDELYEEEEDSQFCDLPDDLFQWPFAIVKNSKQYGDNNYHQSPQFYSITDHQSTNCQVERIISLDSHLGVVRENSSRSLQLTTSTTTTATHTNQFGNEQTNKPINGNTTAIVDSIDESVLYSADNDDLHLRDLGS